MTGMQRRVQVIKQRFPVRDDLEHSELACRFFPEFRLEEVVELFGLVEREFRIEIGFLRPDDSLYALFAPVPCRNPFLWGLFRTLESDGMNEIAAEVNRKRRQRGLPASDENATRSFGDLVRAWCEPASPAAVT